MKTQRFYILLAIACTLSPSVLALKTAPSEASAQQSTEVEKGPHSGRLLRKDGFALELAIFETGIPPEFRVWLTYEGQPVPPSDASLTIVLTRLGGIQDVIKFTAKDDFLRGDTVIYEPHSFTVAIEAEYKGKRYEWHYDNFEGRTSIAEDMANALQIKTATAGKAELQETIKVFGQLIMHPEFTRNISARFDGQIKKMAIGLGQTVSKGQPLVTIESNESLKSYTIYSPIEGIVQNRMAHPGEQTNGRVLLTIVNPAGIMADFAVFPSNRHKIKIGAEVLVSIKGEQKPVKGVVGYIHPEIQPNQSVLVRVHLKDNDAPLFQGAFVSGEIVVNKRDVPLAVKRSGLQAFRDFTVVFAKIGNEYEVRMLDLGLAAGEWVEVLGGLKPGTEYVTENSYIIKADIEKSGASHDH